MTRYDDLALFIDGEWLSAAGRETQKVVDPATGNEIGRLPHATRADLDRALAAAKRGFDVWRKVSPYERARILHRAADIIRERSEHIATQMTWNRASRSPNPALEVAVAADHFDWQGEEGRRAYGRLIPGRAEGQRLMVLREPVGPVAAFTPWNFPANMPARKMSTALAAGCSCIIKPAEETPGTALALARAISDAGVPPGVLNVVFGVPAEISEYLITSPIIRKITFTGSTAVGKLLAGLAAKGVKRATMELGGHAPVIVFEDADAEKAAELSAAAKFRNAGQVCVSPTRFYVHESLHDRFADKFAEIARKLPVGSGFDPAESDGARCQCAAPRCDGRLRRGRPQAWCRSPGRRRADRQCRLFLAADRTEERARRGAHHERRTVRTGRDRQQFPRLRRGGRGGQSAALWPRRLRLHRIRSAARSGSPMRSKPA